MRKSVHVLSGDINLLPFHLRRREIGVKLEKVWKPFVRDCRKKNLNNEEIVFNYRLSKKGRVTENVFGVWIERFWISGLSFGGCNGYTYLAKYSELKTKG